MRLLAGIRRYILGVTIVGGVVAAGCTPPVPAHPEYVDRICDSLCRKRAECKPDWDQKICQTSCRDRGSSRRPYWRADYVDAAVQCITSSSCETILKEVERACFQDTRPEPTEVARRACMAAEQKQHECVGAPVDMDECLNKWNWRAYSDPVLEEIVDCEKQRCGGNQRSRCISEALGGH